MENSSIKQPIKIVSLISVLIVLYIISLNNYLLFHSITEIFTVCIAFAVFIITINSLEYLKNNYIIIVGVAYLFIGFLDFLHTLGYKGMAVFTDYDYYANQLWIAARYMESIVIFLAIILTKQKKKVNLIRVMVILFIATAAIIVSVFLTDIFPICFIEGVGQTRFKIVSEYLINGILLTSLFFTWKNKSVFENTIYRYVVLSIIFTIFSEFSFTFYISNYGISNMIGHYFKVASFCFIYKAIIVKGIKEPYDIIFRELNQTKDRLAYQNTELKNQVSFDGLTNLYNHRHIFECVENQAKRYKLFGEPFVIVFVDVDNFKMINDQYGHLAGDVTLVQIADILKDNTRELDVIGRYGGDEFLIVLANTGIAQGRLVGKKIREAVKEHPFSNEIYTTISVGVAEYSGGDINELFHLADQKMYESKNKGKDIVSC